MSNLTMQSERSGNVAILHVTGRVDFESAPALDNELIKLGAGTNQIVIDAKNIEYISSAGLRAVVKGYQAARKAGGHVRLASVSEPVKTVLRTVGMFDMLKTYDSIKEAVESFN